MTFLVDLAFAVELLAFGLGIAFLIWGYRSKGVGVGLAKVVGYIIAIAAVLGLSCTTFYGSKYWSAGYFSSPVASHILLKKKMLHRHPMIIHRMKRP